MCIYKALKIHTRSQKKNLSFFGRDKNCLVRVSHGVADNVFKVVSGILLQAKRASTTVVLAGANLV